MHVVKPWLFENTKNQVELIYKRQFAAKLDYYNKLTGGEYGIQTGEAAYTSLIKIEGVLDAIYLIPQGRYFSNENAIRCRVLLAEDNIENDIALIQSDKGELPAKCRFVNITDSIDTGNETLTVGKHVYTIGFPRGYDGFIQDYKSKGLQAVASGGSIIQADKQYHFGYNAPTTGGLKRISGI